MPVKIFKILSVLAVKIYRVFQNSCLDIFLVFFNISSRTIISRILHSE